MRLNDGSFLGRFSELHFPSTINLLVEVVARAYRVPDVRRCPSTDSPQATFISMLIPQFTIRRLFWLVAICAVLCVGIMLAARGVAVARSMIAMVVMIGSSFCMFAVLFVAGAIVDRLRPVRPISEESPFAQHSLPPSYVVPKDE